MDERGAQRVKVRLIEEGEVPYTEKVQKIGDSYYILIPFVVRKVLDLKEGDIVTVFIKVVKKKEKQRNTLKIYISKEYIIQHEEKSNRYNRNYSIHHLQHNSMLPRRCPRCDRRNNKTTDRGGSKRIILGTLKTSICTRKSHRFPCHCWYFLMDLVKSEQKTVQREVETKPFNFL